jgi:hypothetical protein
MRYSGTMAGRQPVFDQFILLHFLIVLLHRNLIQNSHAGLESEPVES